MSYFHLLTGLRSNQYALRWRTVTKTSLPGEINIQRVRSGVGTGSMTLYILYEHRAAVSDEDRLWWLDTEDILASYIISQFLTLSEYQILCHANSSKGFKTQRQRDASEDGRTTAGGKNGKKWQHSNSCRTKRSRDNEMWQLGPQSPTVTNLLQNAFSSDSCAFPGWGWLSPFS